MAHLVQENMSTNLFILDEVVGFGDVLGLRPISGTQMMKGAYPAAVMPDAEILCFCIIKCF